MDIRKYAKKDIALQQIETAVRLFQEGRELFSVITLAGAAEEVVGQLLRQRGGEPAGLFSVLKVLRPGAKRVEEPQWLSTHETETLVHTDARQEALFLLGRAIDDYEALAGAPTQAMAEFNRKYRGKG